MKEGDNNSQQETGFLARAAAAWGYLCHVASRFAADQCPQRAAALTYTTLLAMVPLLAISFAVFSAFEAFGEMQNQVQTFIFENFVPQVGSVVQEHLEKFASKTRGLSIIGALFLAVTSVLLLSSISSAFNHIWRVRQTKGLVVRLPVYWMILTLTPLLLGASVALSTYLFALAQATGVEQYTGPLTRLAVIVPLLVQIAGLFVLYRFAPNYPVRWSDAMAGSVTAGLVLELLKRGFGYYVTTFPTYQTIYGALATIPIFLIWMYVMWNVVLWGAEMAAALPEWRSGISRRESEQRTPAAMLAAAAAILALLLAAHRGGGGLRWRHLQRRAGQPAELLTAASEALRKSHYIQKNERDVWFLTRDLDRATLADLHSDLGLSTAAAAVQVAHADWGAKLAEALRGAEEAGHAAMDMPLESLLATEESAQIVRLATGDEPGDDEGEDENDEPRDYKNRLLAILGLAWLVGR
ncbi:MAG: YihY family inner membrane protein [Alphaproteobacteria bacterium]|nr:YihY family inner membrane protein [Alphaproteobacteria bacterium]